MRAKFMHVVGASNLVAIVSLSAPVDLTRIAPLSSMCPASMGLAITTLFNDQLG